MPLPSSLHGRIRNVARRPLLEPLPRERIVYPAPCACPDCAGVLKKLGEDMT
jgi:transposase